MIKALHDSYEWYEHNGEPYLWTVSLDEIVSAVNNPDESHHPVLVYMKSWLLRFYKEGVTEELLNDLNEKIKNIRFSKIIMPSDLSSHDINQLHRTYLCRNSSIVDYEIYAANDFSKLLTNGDLDRLKSCVLDGCQKLFLGRPQSKWCSKTCGSKYRVSKKRKLDAQ